MEYDRRKENKIVHTCVCVCVCVCVLVKVNSLLNK